MIINILITLLSISVLSILLIGLITQYLHDKSRSNKFRQWWSRHIVDLDDNYND